MTAPARKLATYRDLLALPGNVRAQIVGGEILVEPSPTPEQQSTVGELYAELRGPFQRGRGGPGGWWLIPDVDVSFGPHDVFRPDVSGWGRDRVPSFPKERPVSVRPDWICEGLSPGTAALDQGEKRSAYLRAGVPWYWIADPLNRTLSVLRLEGSGYVLEQSVGDRGAARLPPFEDIELPLDAIFPPLA